MNLKEMKMQGKRVNEMNLSDGIKVSIPAENVSYKSLCWSCIHSGTDKENRCSWDAKLKMPKGAIYFTRTSKRYGIVIPTIIECPLYKKGHKKYKAQIKDGVFDTLNM